MSSASGRERCERNATHGTPTKENGFSICLHVEARPTTNKKRTRPDNLPDPGPRNTTGRQLSHGETRLRGRVREMGGLDRAWGRPVSRASHGLRPIHLTHGRPVFSPKFLSGKDSVLLPGQPGQYGLTSATSPARHEKFESRFADAACRNRLRGKLAKPPKWNDRFGGSGPSLFVADRSISQSGSSGEKPRNAFKGVCCPRSRLLADAVLLWPPKPMGARDLAIWSAS